MNKKNNQKDSFSNYSSSKKDNIEHHWNVLATQILQVLKISIDKTSKYSKNLFQNQESYLKKVAKEYFLTLKKIQSFQFQINNTKLFNQFLLKLKGLSQLKFPSKIINFDKQNHINFINKNLQPFIKLLTKAYPNNNLHQQLKINEQLIRKVIQQDSKLNYQQNLFILKSYIIQNQQKNKQNKVQNIKIPILSNQKQTIIKIKLEIMHSYNIDQCIEIVLSNIPSLNNVKKSYNSWKESEEYNYASKQDRQFNIKRMLGDYQDSKRSSQNCFKYFGHAMQLQFFNSLIQPIPLNRYLTSFSIIQNLNICKGLILGGLNTLLQYDSVQQLSDSDSQIQQQIQQICKQFCNDIFNGYFQGEQQSKEVICISRNIWKIKRQTHKSVYGILQDHWFS